MRGAVLYGPRDIRFEDRPEPKSSSRRPVRRHLGASELSKRDRSLITVAALIRRRQRRAAHVPPEPGQRKRRHRGRAYRDYHSSGLLQWVAMSPITVAKEVFKTKP
jgi:hypothetical protein